MTDLHMRAANMPRSGRKLASFDMRVSIPSSSRTEELACKCADTTSAPLGCKGAEAAAVSTIWQYRTVRGI